MEGIVNRQADEVNNKEMKKLLKENSTKMEIAKEVHSNKKVADIIGDRLSRKRHFPPC